MIIDRIENWNTYFQGNTAWKCVFDFLRTLNSDAKVAEHVIQEENIRASVSEYETRQLEVSMIEAHRKYVDIQFLLGGSEIVKCFPTDCLAVSDEYEDARDAAFYEYSAHTPVNVNLTPGIFVALFPQDAHMPGLIAGDKPNSVKKVVIKIKRTMLEK